MAAIGVVAHVKLEGLRRFATRDGVLARGHQGLGNVAARSNVSPHAVCELVAPLGGFAAVASEGLEEELFARVPKALGVGRCHHLGVRNAGQQHRLGGLRHPHGLQGIGMAQQGQVAFVGQQCVGLRVGGEHHRVLQIRLAQVGVCGLGQGKVGQAVVCAQQPCLTCDLIGQPMVSIPVTSR